MSKNYYLVLGITSDATLGDIKEAYRRLVKEFHPDRYGSNHSPFLAIQEAYSVLSDPIKRQNHDGYVLNQRPRAKHIWRKSRHGESSRGAVEPLIPEKRDAFDFNASYPKRYYHSYIPSYHQLFDEMFSHFRWTHDPTVDRFEHLEVVVNITAEEAYRGGQFKVSLPGKMTCPSCSGRGWIGEYECIRCRGEGEMAGKYPVMLSYPPGIPDNHTIQMPFNSYDGQIQNLTIRFHIVNR